MSRFCGNLLKSTCVEDRARDRRLSWLLLRVETSLSELGLCAFCCDWYEPQDIRCISLVSVFFCWKENSQVKNSCLYISFFDPLIIFQLFLFSRFICFTCSSKYIFHDRKFAFSSFPLFLLRWTSYNNHILHRPHRDLLSYVTVSWKYWENVVTTRTNRSVIKFVYLPTLTRLFLLVADASRRLGCFSPCLCYTPDVADRSELIVTRNAQSSSVCLCTIHVSVSRLRPRSEFVPSWVCQIPLCPQHVVLNTSVSWQDKWWQNAAECDTHCELLDQWIILTT